jgi:hypothetical protein
VIGQIELIGDALELAGDELTMIAYSAAPGSQAEDQLKLLAAWSATAGTRDTESAGYRLPATNQDDAEGLRARAASRPDGMRPELVEGPSTEPVLSLSEGSGRMRSALPGVRLRGFSRPRPDPVE